MANDPTVKAGSWRPAPSRRSCGSPSTRCATSCRCSGWSTRPAPASPTRSSCSPAGGAPGGSSTTRCGCRARRRRSAACSVRRAGGAYIPAFCDVVIMVEGNALDVPRARPGWPRWSSARSPRSRRWAAPGCTPPCRAAATTSPSTTPTPSTRPGLLHLPAGARGARGRPCTRPAPPAASFGADLVPADDDRPSTTCTTVIDALVDAESFFEVKPLFARELIVGFALLEGRPVGIVANNPAVKGGVLFVDSADKAARFIWAVRRLQRAAGVPGRRARLHDRHRGRAPGHHPPRREDDHRRLRGDRRQGVGDPAQGLRRRALRHERAGVRARGLHARCRPPRSP